MNLDPRPIVGSVAIHNFKPEHEKVSRWSFMKVLREHSDLKEYYPEVNPYVECYKVRPNTYAIFSPSIMPGCGDVWSYLIKWLRTSGITAGIPVAAPLHHMDERLMHPEDRGTRWRRVMQAV